MAAHLPGTIAIVAHTHPSVSKGGAEIAAYTLFEGLLQSGVSAIFIAICPAGERDRLLLTSDREFAIITDHHRYDHFYHLSASDVWRQLKVILASNDVRLVNFHHFLQVGVNALRALAAETGIPFTVTLHEFLAICANHGQMVTRPARRLCQMSSPVACATCFPENSRQQFAARKQVILSSLLSAAGFISPSQFLAERMVGWGLPREKFVVIENGLREPGRSDRRVHAPVEGRPWVFGYFGQITPFKGADILLDAIDLLARHPDISQKIRIRVHGNLMGQEPPFIARFTESFAKHGFATYAGPYDNADVRTLMQACDYVVVPSTWWENSPVVIQEAYGAGRPLICTGIGGMAEKVPNRLSGLHFRLGDAGDLARAMFEAADEVLYKALCSGLPEVSDRMGMARDYLAAFSRLVPPPPTADVPRVARRRNRAGV